MLLLLPALLASAGLRAQSTTGDDPVPRYDVEIVVFKNVKVPKSREFVLPVASPSKDKNILDLSSSASVRAAGKLGYELLPTSEFRLAEEVSRLIESERYELLTHIAWRQPGVELGQSMPVWIRGGQIFGDEYTSIDNQLEYLESLPQAISEDGKGGASYGFDEQGLKALEAQLLEQQKAGRHGGLYEFEGKITISLSRYLHAYVDLVLRRPRHVSDPVLNVAEEDQSSAVYAARAQILDNYRLRERRRMRSRNLHYLDNPEFGMLILITPFETPAAVEESVPPEAESEPAIQG